MNPILIIPSRLAATRLPNKPLADIHGRPMIAWVWERARAAKIGRVVVAAGDAEIVQIITALGGEAVLTDPALPNGSARVAAALAQLDPEKKHDVVLNIQGDLPNIESETLSRVVETLRAVPNADIATPAAIITQPWELETNSVVKIALELKNPSPLGGEGGAPAPDEGSLQTGKALYFSRNLIPSGNGPHYHHIGVYGFRRAAMEKFMALPTSAIALRENLEQLTALHAGMHIEVCLVSQIPQPVDTAEDLERVRGLLSHAQ